MATLSTARGRGRHTGKEDGLTNSLEYQCPYGVDRKSRALPVAEQQGYLPSAETEPCAAAAGDLQQPGREIRAEGGTLCSRESGGTDI